MKKRGIIILVIAFLLLSISITGILSQDYFIAERNSLDNGFKIYGELNNESLKYFNITAGSEYFTIEKEDKIKIEN